MAPQKPSAANPQVAIAQRGADQRKYRAGNSARLVNSSVTRSRPTSSHNTDGQQGHIVEGEYPHGAAPVVPQQDQNDRRERQSARPRPPRRTRWTGRLPVPPPSAGNHCRVSIALAGCWAMVNMPKSRRPSQQQPPNTGRPALQEKAQGAAGQGDGGEPLGRQARPGPRRWGWQALSCSRRAPTPGSPVPTATVPVPAVMDGRRMPKGVYHHLRRNVAHQVQANQHPPIAGVPSHFIPFPSPSPAVPSPSRRGSGWGL